MKYKLNQKREELTLISSSVIITTIAVVTMVKHLKVRAISSCSGEMGTRCLLPYTQLYNLCTENLLPFYV